MCFLVGLLVGLLMFLMGFLIGVLMGVIYTFYNQIIQIILQYMDYKGLILE